MWWSSLTQLLLGAAVFFIGLWGRRNAGELVTRSHTEDRSADPTAAYRRLRVIRRGGLACQVVGVFFAAFSVPPLL